MSTATLRLTSTIDTYADLAGLVTHAAATLQATSQVISQVTSATKRAVRGFFGRLAVALLTPVAVLAVAALVVGVAAVAVCQ